MGLDVDDFLVGAFVVGVGIEDGTGAADDGAGLVVLVLLLLLLLVWFPPKEPSCNSEGFTITTGSRIILS